MTMRCLQCDKEVLEQDAKFFLQVFMCAPCADVTEKARNRVRGEIESALAMLDATFRTAVTHKSLTFSMHQLITMGRVSILEEFARMEAQICRSHHQTKAHSSVTTRPGAPSVDGSSSSSSVKAVD